MKIHPAALDISSESRLVIYNITLKKFDRIQLISPNSYYEINDDYILNNLVDFKYKLQVMIDGKWIDTTKYLKLYNDKLLDELFNDKIQPSLKELTKLFEGYWENYSINHIPEIRTAFANTMRSIWNNPNISHINLSNLINISTNTNVQIPLLWKNIIFYIEEVLKLNQNLKKLGLSNLSFKELNSCTTFNKKHLNEYIKSRILKLEQKDLEFSNLFIGLYYSYIGMRIQAIEAFHKAHNFKENYIKVMKIDIGSYTYFNNKQEVKYNPEIVFHNPIECENSKITILLSMDTKFLKYYGAQLFYSIIVLRQYHFHFHIVDENVISDKAIKEAKSIYHNLRTYMNPKNKIVSPTFSSEECPTFVNDMKTYYACSRYVIAKDIMKKYNNDIFIMDADFFINDEIDSYISNISKHDVSIPFSNSLLSLFPWRRIMAGYVFLKNNTKSHEFIGIVKQYITSNLHQENSWTLDQNALSYAFENIYDIYPDINIGDSNTYYTPMYQPLLRKLIEKI